MEYINGQSVFTAEEQALPHVPSKAPMTEQEALYLRGVLRFTAELRHGQIIALAKGDPGNKFTGTIEGHEHNLQITAGILEGLKEKTNIEGAQF